VKMGIYLLVLALLAPLVSAYDNGAPGSRLPVLGWSSWVALGPDSAHPIFDFCDEDSVKAAADAFVAVGLKDAGYTGFHLDDCWANKDRNTSGYLVAELDHFPNGMKPVADYVHEKGMDFGLYTCAGSHTCVGGRPGSKDTGSRTLRSLPSGASTGSNRTTATPTEWASPRTTTRRCRAP